MDVIFVGGARALAARHFVVPVGVNSRPHGNDPAEEEERGAAKGGTGGVRDTVAPEPLVRSIQRCIEFGKNAAHVERSEEAATGTTDCARRLAALQSALSILCHIAAMDKSYYYVSSNLAAAPAPSGSRAGTSNKHEGQRTRAPSSIIFSLTDIYTTVRALKLEYEDALKQQKSGGAKLPMGVQSVAVSISSTEARVDASLNLLEFTLVQMLLNFDRARYVSPAYVGDILRAMPQIFATEKRPLTVLQKNDSQTAPPKRFPDTEDDSDDVSHAATSIVFKALQTLKSKDCLRVLSPAKSRNAARLGAAPLSVSLEGMMAEALNGAYRWRGLYGAMHDMKVLLYGVYATVPAEQEQHVNACRLQFERSIREQYVLFLYKTGLSAEVGGPLLVEETMFDVNPLPTEADAASYTDTQLKSLKLLTLLREVDTNRWFEYPVFDMANIELSSIEKWVRGSTFAVKTNRDAFVALRDVLEQMVDSCVLSYGPTSPFSQVITLMRQRLVDAAREVEML
ncbi:uncharacterized protein Tco025E_08503 [Trypanosoma conorhini]|uniref:Uncharacterized protein n=1 Tax=Trypanosoma conorhini TaxID=83891 RepID=A0A3R7RFV8_9TRYP|nr:uncharacterized protein Tco025E_08503 [Trypanosoma conorhini]RNF01893.1 hypothetical protein Tco025E_08503 [Trypanosoma conorhini]